jgi:hypothetical protein
LCLWNVCELHTSSRTSQRGHTSMGRRGAKYRRERCEASRGRSARRSGSRRSSSW